MKPRIKFILSIVLIVFFQTGLQARGYLTLRYLTIEGNLIFIGNADADSAVSPLIPGLGIALPLFFTPYLYLKTGLSFTGTNYLYNGTVPVPAEDEHREYLVLIPEVDCFFGFKLPITNSLEWGLMGGCAFILRFPIALSDSETADYNAVANWFYTDLRFFYPAVELFLKWNVEKNFGLVFSGKSLFPLFHLWDNTGVPFWDQLIVSGSAGIFFGFPAE